MGSSTVTAVPGLCLALLFAASCTPADRAAEPAVVSTPADLLEADRAFADRARESGLDGWMEFFAADAARLPRLGQPAVRGLDEIRRTDSALFADPTLRLTWEPTDAGLFTGGVHGFTTGRYELLERQPDGSERAVARGGYVSWWRRDADGQWRVILDTGAPDPPPAP